MNTTDTIWPLSSNLPIFDRSEPSSGSGLVLVLDQSWFSMQTFLLNWLDFTSWSRPFSRCIRLQFPSTARNNYGWRHRLKHCRFSSWKYFVYFSRRRVTARCSSSGSKWHHLIPEEAPAPNQHQKHFGWNGVIMTFDWHMHKIILLLK